MATCWRPDDLAAACILCLLWPAAAASRPPSPGDASYLARSSTHSPSLRQRLRTLDLREWLLIEQRQAQSSPFAAAPEALLGRAVPPTQAVTAIGLRSNDLVAPYLRLNHLPFAEDGRQREDAPTLPLLGGAGLKLRLNRRAALSLDYARLTHGASQAGQGWVRLDMTF